MIVSSEADLDGLKKSGRIVRLAIETMASALEPGITTLELDQIGRNVLDKEGSVSAPECVYDFPGATCISINPVVAHGIPSDTIIKAGDLVNIDVSAHKDGFYTDAGASFVVPPVSPLLHHLCSTTRKARDRAIRRIKAGELLNCVGRIFEKDARKTGFTVIENLASHGVGRSIHEKPDIPGIYQKNDPRRFEDGQVVTIEPFISTGGTFADEGEGPWELLTEPQYFTAQFEHTIVVTRRGSVIVT
ncbi:MAG: type I methionyl aminopeptidase [Cohaesibacteraceae bacterium]|nr:type I methionyl aminopeptidase [Cohaesibacteraceae bacterium]